MTMDPFLIHFEAYIRLTFFLGFFTILAVWQNQKINRQLLTPLKTRWMRHFSLLVMGTACVRLVFYTILPLAIAVAVSKKKIGLFNMPEFAFLSYWGQVIVGVILLDLVIYLQHRTFHRVSLAWRFHKMHHSDKELDVSTGIRFHPIELVISMGVKILAIAFIAPPVLAVLIFEILLNGASLFTHTNVKIPDKIDKILRYFIVTPTMHRIHHSDIPSEHNSNFGFLFSIWDKWFSTYTAAPKMGHSQMNIGLVDYQDPKYQTVKVMLWTPFERTKKYVPKKTKTHMSVPP